MAVDIKVRWADNTADLRRNLKEGVNQIEATTAAAEKMAKSLGGDNLIKAAHNYAAAIQQIGGVEKLTANERERGNALLTKAIEKYTALGKDAPDALKLLHQQTLASTDSTNSLLSSATKLVGVFGAFGITAGISAFTALAKSALDDADALTRLHDKTAVSVETLQRLRMATDDTGDSLDAVATSINKMQRNLASGNDSALASLHQLGLNFADIRAMSPEDQFTTIAAAIRAVEDPAEQVNLAMSIFGKGGAEILPTIKRGFNEIKDAAPVMSAETVRALDEMGDAWTKFWRSAKVEAGEGLVSLLTGSSKGERADIAKQVEAAKKEMAEIQKGVNALIDKTLRDTQGWAPFREMIPPALPDELEALSQKWQESAPAMMKAAKAAEDYQKKLDAVNEKIREATRDIGNLTPAQQQSVLMYERMGLSVEDIATKLNVSVLAVKKFTEATKEQERYLASLTEHIGAKAIPNFQGLIMTWDQMLNTGKGLIYDGLIPMTKGFDDASRAELALKLYTDELTKSNVALQNALARNVGLMPDLSRNTNALLREIREGGPRAIDIFAASLNTLPEIMVRAFEGGGGMEGALKAYYTTLARSLFGKGGVWEQEISTAMSIMAASIQAGFGIASGFTTPGSRGSNIANYAGQGAAIGTSILPGYGTAVGAGVGALVGALKVPEDEKAARDALNAFKAQVGAVFDATASGQQRIEAGGDAWNKMIIQVREAYLATGHTAAEAMQVLGDATRHTREDVEKLPEDLAKINEVLRQQQQDSNDLNAAMTKYKFTIEEMGPAFQKQELTKQALQLENEFRLLVGAGASADLVLDRMGDSINDFIHIALKTGTEVPAEMRPMLEQMVKMGTLTDASGDAITDLNASGLTFSETMTQGFDRVVTALEKVLRQLGYVDDAVTNLPSTHPIHIPIDFPMPNAPIIDSGFLDPHGAGIPGAQYALGSGGIRDFGVGTIATLHGREAVVTEAEFQGMKQSTGTGGQDDATLVQVSMTNTFHLTGANAQDAEQVKDIVTKDIADKGRIFQTVRTVAKRAARDMAR